MSDHSDSVNDSTDLCDELFSHLARRIPGLQRSQSVRWCALFQKGRTRFAYVSHRKTMSRIEVWCLGEISALADGSSLTFYPRKPTAGGFGRDFEARFFVDYSSQLDDAAQILYDVSYRESKPSR